MKYNRKTIFSLFVVLLFVLFAAGCYTMIHPPFKERVVVVKEKPADSDFEATEEDDEEYAEEEEYVDEDVEEVHVYHHYNEWDYYPNYWTYRHRNHYPYSGFGMYFHYGSYPWDMGFYSHSRWYEPFYSVHCYSHDFYAPWAYYDRWGHGYYPAGRYYYAPHLYNRYHAYNYDHYGYSRSYKKRDFGMRENVRDGNVTLRRLPKVSQNIGNTDGLSKSSDKKDSYEGRRT